jgi:hypothetical protein
VDWEDKIRSLGRRDNTNGTFQLDDNNVQKTLSIREEVEIMMKKRGVRDFAQLAEADVRDMRLRAMEDYGVAKGTFGQMWGLVSSSNALWPYVRRLLEGEFLYDKDKSTTPTSMYPFTRFAFVPEEIRIQFYEDIYKGVSKISELPNNCIRYKGKQQICKQVLDMIVTRTPPTNPVHAHIVASDKNKTKPDWGLVKAKFPFATEDSTIEMFANRNFGKVEAERNKGEKGFTKWVFDAISKDLKVHQHLANSARIAEVLAYYSQIILFTDISNNIIHLSISNNIIHIHISNNIIHISNNIIQFEIPNNIIAISDPPTSQRGEGKVPDHDQWVACHPLPLRRVLDGSEI